MSIHTAIIPTILVSIVMTELFLIKNDIFEFLEKLFFVDIFKSYFLRNFIYILLFSTGKSYNFSNNDHLLYFSCIFYSKIEIKDISKLKNF